VQVCSLVKDFARQAFNEIPTLVKLHQEAGRSACSFLPSEWVLLFLSIQQHLFSTTYWHL
jgi:hypothetical protein